MLFSRLWCGGRSTFCFYTFLLTFRGQNLVTYETSVLMLGVNFCLHCCKCFMFQGILKTDYSSIFDFGCHLWECISIKWLISEITTRNLVLSRPLHIISAMIVKMLIVSVVHIRFVVYWILHNVKSKLSAWWRSRDWLSLLVFSPALCCTLVKSKF